jgi:hypothetical protein
MSGSKRLELGEQILGAKQEVARVPQITLGEIAGCRCGIRLLHEGGHRLRAIDAQGLTGADVAIAGARLRRRYAESHDMTGERCVAP